MRILSEQGGKNTDGEPTQKIPWKELTISTTSIFGVEEIELTKALPRRCFNLA